MVSPSSVWSCLSTVLSALVEVGAREDVSEADVDTTWAAGVFCDDVSSGACTDDWVLLTYSRTVGHYHRSCWLLCISAIKVATSTAVE